MNNFNFATITLDTPIDHELEIGWITLSRNLNWKYHPSPRKSLLGFIGGGT